MSYAICSSCDVSGNVGSTTSSCVLVICNDTTTDIARTTKPRSHMCRAVTDNIFTLDDILYERMSIC